jgi:hypothetical protein
MSWRDRVICIAAQAVAEVVALAAARVLQIKERHTRQRPVEAPGDGRVNDPIPALRGEMAQLK